MKALAVYLLFVFVLWGCSHSLGEVKCRHEALLCALVAGESNPTRIAFGPSTDYEGIWHAQAQVYISGEWSWVHLRGNNVVSTIQDRFKSLNYMDPSDFARMYIRKTLPSH